MGKERCIALTWDFFLVIFRHLYKLSASSKKSDFHFSICILDLLHALHGYRWMEYSYRHRTCMMENCEMPYSHSRLESTLLTVIKTIIPFMNDVVVAIRIQWHFGFNGYSVDDVHTCDKRGEWVDKSHELQKKARQWENGTKRKWEVQWDEPKDKSNLANCICQIDLLGKSESFFSVLCKHSPSHILIKFHHHGRALRLYLPTSSES